MKVAIEAWIEKRDGRLEIIENEYSVISDNPFTSDNVEKSDVIETIRGDERVSGLPDGEYHVFFVGKMSYIESYSWEYAVTEIDGIEIEIESLSVWQYNEPETGRSLGQYVVTS